MNLLVTGGMGFIGSNLIRWLRGERPAWRIVNLDALTYAANPENLAGLDEDERYRFVRGDVTDRAAVARLFEEETFDAVVHCAAESHVDRSIDDGFGFLRTNVEGTLVLLEAGRASDRPVRHLQMSTDEVYGTLAPGDAPFTEATPLDPRSPYSASKAAADQLCLAYHRTHGIDAVVTRCSNNYGPYQHPEKLVPLMVTAALTGRRLPVYGDGRQRRDWLHVEDHCRGVVAALERGGAGEVYNLGGGEDVENLTIIRTIVELVGAAHGGIEFVTDRPGHDRRYAVSAAKAERELGWRPERTLDEGMADTVAWYREHEDWWRDDARAAHDASDERIAGWTARAGG